MKLETRKLDGGKARFILLIAESEEDAKLLDELGNLNDTIAGSLHLADGFGPLYLSLPFKSNSSEMKNPE